MNLMIRHSTGALARFVVVVAIFAMVAAACSSDDTSTGVSQDEFDAVTTELADANAQITALQGQLSSAQVETIVTQTAEFAAPPASAPIPDDGWSNAESVRGGLILVAQLDSSGPDAWDIAAHPRVYFTSESFQSNYYETNDLEATGFGNFAGWHVVDAYSKEVVASALYQDLVPQQVNRGPHGVAVSPDGKWGYVGFATPAAEDCDPVTTACNMVGYVMIVNVQTMKVDKILRQQSWSEGGWRSQAIHHIQCWTQDSTGEDFCILQWGFGANGGPHYIVKPNDNNRVYRSITYDDIRPMGHPFTTPSPDGQYVYVSVGSNWIREGHDTAFIAKLDIDTGVPEYMGPTGSHPIGITHTQDGKYTYVVDGHSSFLYKLDNETGEPVAHASSGIAGPYGICLNWDETEAWVNGKGEGTANLGNSMSIFDLTRFRASRDHGNTPFYLGGSASSVDHCALHPDPEVNEVWISNMKGWETIVVSLDTYTVTDYITTPHTGDTHGMAFVYYDGGWDDGRLMVDMGGPKDQELQDLIKANAAASGDA
jgi:DNA-binding beta-propeller fold protein YncE